ncbi:MAG TPA: hypothetical protein VKB95_16000 [Chitinophagaceae bacterium]|nr:hypothetical protein [Chitinophagaceae bacterium]
MTRTLLRIFIFFMGLIKAGKPKITIAFEFRKVACLNKPPRKALKPAFAEGSDFNLQYLDVEHGLPSSEILTIFKDSRGMCVWRSPARYGICFRRFLNKINLHICFL